MKFLIALAVFAVAVIASSVWHTKTQETEYLRTTTLEVRAAHEAMAQRLQETENGTLVVFEAGHFACVAGNDSPGHPRRKNMIRLQYVSGDVYEHKSVSLVGRYAAKIVPPDDPEWPKLAKKFLTDQR